MPHPVTYLLDRAAKTLYDETHVVFGQDELLVHLNAAVAEIVQLDPKAYMVNAPFRCAPGALQTVPGDAIALVDVLYNTDASGKPGRAIAAVGIDSLKAARPDWAQSPPSAVARHFVADPRDPKRFYLWPPQPDPPGYVQAVYQMVPPDVGLADSFPLPDLYEEAAWLFMVWHCLMRRDQDPQRAQLFYAQFLQELDVDVKNIARIQAGRPDGWRASSAPPEGNDG
jgi:hypothetical protein